jgi:hypothetical protein
MGSKVVKHLAHGTGPESLRAGRDVEFIVLILLLQVRRKKKMLVECHWNCFLKCKGVREYFVPGSQIDTSVVTCKPEINKAKKLIKLVRKRNIHY